MHKILGFRFALQDTVSTYCFGWGGSYFVINLKKNPNFVTGIRQNIEKGIYFHCTCIFIYCTQYRGHNNNMPLDLCTQSMPHLPHSVKQHIHLSDWHNVIYQQDDTRWLCWCIRVHVCVVKNSPLIKITGIDTASSSAEVFAGKALIRPGTPAPCIRAQRVTHHVLLGCSTHGHMKEKTGKEVRIAFI